MSDVLPPSNLGSHSSRCLLSNGFVPRSPFTGETFTTCGPSVTDLNGGVVQTDASGHGVRRRRRTLCSQRRPLTEAVAGPADFGARRAGCGCQAASVLKYYIFQSMSIVFYAKKCNWLHIYYVLCLSLTQ